MRDIRRELPQPIRVLLLCPEPNLQEQMRQFFSSEERYPITLVDVTDSIERCRLLINDTLPHVVVLSDLGKGPDWTESIFQLSKEINLDHHNMTSIVLATQFDAGYLRRAMNTGARDVVEAQRLGSGWTALLGSISDSILAAYEFIRSQTRETVARKLQVHESNVVSLFSGKGGVGKSVLATALAGHMARRRPDLQVALLDFDIQFGTISPLLSLEPVRTVAQLAPIAKEISAATVRKFMTTKGVGDGATLHILASPTLPLELPVLSRQSTAAILSAVRSAYDYVVVDLPTQLTDVSVTTLQLSDLIMLVTELEMLSVRSTRQVLSLLQDPAISFRPAEVGVVLNKTQAGGLIKVTDVNELFSNVIADFPWDASFIDEHVSAGEPIGIVPTHNKFMESLEALTTRLDVQAPKPQAEPALAAPTAKEKEKSGPFNLKKLIARTSN